MILSILKVIGIILLIILAIIIFILLLVLLSPIRYRFSGSYDAVADGDVLVKWNPVILRVIVTYHDNHLEYTVKLFGGVVMTNTSAEISWLGRKFFDFGEEEESIKQPPPDKETKKAPKHSGADYALMDSLEEGVDLQDEVNDTHTFEEDRKETFNEKRSSTSFAKRISQKIKAFQRKWHEFVNTLKKAQNKKDALLRVYHSRRFRQVKQDLKQYIGEVFRILRPDQLEGYVKFGFEDPANTGYVLGILAMILPLYQEFLTIEPDFTMQNIKGHLQGKGKIRLISVVKLAIKVILNKNLIKVTKKVQTILEA